MKAEERHELRENDLATWLQYGLWAFLKENGSYILLVLALGFLGFQLWNLYERKQEAKRQEAWVSLNEASQTADPLASLQKIIDTSTIKPVQAQACLEMGQNYDGMAMFPEQLDNRKLTRDQALRNASDYFQKALEFQGEDPVIFTQAHLGIAAVYEDRGDWDKAKAEYQLILDNKMLTGAQAPLATLAKDRMNSLEDRRKAPRLAMTAALTIKRPEATPGLGGTGGVKAAPTTNSVLPNLLPPATRGAANSTPSTSPIFGPISPIGPAPAAPSTAPSSNAPATEPK
jgi:predicted negative regulator of RcsB-dependent stress response